VSSQFVSALLLVAPLMERGLDLRVSGSLPSRPYVELTVDTLKRFHVKVEHARGTSRWRVPPGPARPAVLAVEGDWSASAFFVAAVAVAGGRIEVARLSTDSRQGDRVVCDVARSAGVRVEATAGGISVAGRARRPFTADLTHAPDTFPAIAAVAACGRPGTELSGLDHLKHKESDRLAVMIDNLRRLGAEVVVSAGAARFVKPIDLDPHAVRLVTAAGDHRIAMAMAVVSLAAGPLELDDPACVSKSFPGFWDSWSSLVGGHQR
jgi:3-phosphoshikimate 1-carboxyvinyltransferase